MYGVFQNEIWVISTQSSENMGNLIEEYLPGYGRAKKTKGETENTQRLAVAEKT